MVMDKIFDGKLNLKYADILFRDKTSDVIRLVNGDILKVFTPLYLKVLQLDGINLERDLSNHENIKLASSILKPKSLVYSSNGSFEGYISKGFNTHDTNFATFVARSIARRDLSLEEITVIYKKLEDIVRKNPEVVFPSLCDLTGIYISDDNKFKISDFDELQIGESRVLGHSSRVEDKNNETISNNKKYYNNGLYTKNLDKKSLLHIYFLLTFGLDISSVPANVNIDDILSTVGIEDSELSCKIKDMFYSEKDNEYLSSDLEKVACEYTLRKKCGNRPYDYSEPSRVLVHKK